MTLAGTTPWLPTLALHNPGMVTHPGNPTFLEEEVEGLQIQGHPWVDSKFKVSLGYLRTCVKEGRREGKKEREFIVCL